MKDGHAEGGLQALLARDLAATSLLTLYCHAADARSESPILGDAKSAEIVASIYPILAASASPFARYLTCQGLDSHLITHIAMRATRYDTYVKDFLSRHPDGVVVDIGSGLDSRFQRIDNGWVAVLRSRPARGHGCPASVL
jgi:O-methyltransferase involved in polyketide biosynthesis